MLAPTAETRRELTTPADDYVSSRAGVNTRPVKTPAYQGAVGISPRVACRLLLVFVRLSSERARQTVRQDCSFGKKQECPFALLVVVQPGSRR
jgi:hypothetical protein